MNFRPKYFVGDFCFGKLDILYDLEYNPRGTIYFWTSKVGVLFEGGFNRGGGGNKFRPEGAKFFAFFKQKCVFNIRNLHGR